jgi:uncharacterized protein (DUF427 family)
MSIKSRIHRIEIEDHHGRVTGRAGGRTVFDTTRAKVLHEGRLPDRLYVPLEDFDHELLEESSHDSHCPFKGDARYWSIRTADGLVEDAVWSYPEPKEGVAEIAGHASFYGDKLDVEGLAAA